MSFQYSLYGTLLLISAFLVLYLAIYSFKKRNSDMHIYFVLLMSSVFFWCLGAGMEFFSVEIWAKIFWTKISYIGVAIAPTLWFLLVLSYAKYDKYLKREYIVLLITIPLMVVLAAFTNEWHRLLWVDITPVSSLPGSLLIYAHGPIFWFDIVYSFFLILSGIIVLLKLFINASSTYRPQILILLFSGLVPLIFSIIYAGGLFPVLGLDITPFSIAIGGLLLAISIFKFHFLDIMPIAHKILFKNMINGVMVFDIEDRLIEANSSSEIIGIDDKSTGKSAKELLDHLPELKEFYFGSESELEIFLKEPVNLWILAQKTPIYDDKVLQGHLLIVQNINPRKNVEKALNYSEERYKTLTDMSPDSIAVIIDKKIVFANKSSLKLLGAKNTEEIMGKNIIDFIHPNFIEIAKKRHYEVYIERNPQDFIEEKIITLDGITKDIEVGDVPIMYDNQPAVQLVVRDITERKKLENRLKKSLKEKDLMMKEIHHRVKNNLMVIQSLLQLQSRYIKDKDTLNIFRESQNRAKSMALIHQRLYQSDDLKRIDFGEYARSLSIDLFRSNANSPELINLDIDVEKVMLDVNTAIPLGLILNELVTNSLKHAFPDGKSGKISIKFHPDGSKFNLTVIDNGAGIPDNLNDEKSDSLGLRLVNSLCEQIGADLNINSKNGTTFEIKFEDVYSKTTV
jgi:PAS domain S-box-containing protein